MPDKSWKPFIDEERNKAYFQKLTAFIECEREAGKTIYPPSNQVFEAFNLTPLSEVKVVILGQDPYHGASQAHGLSFSVQDGIKIPPSLRNMYKELATDIDGFEIPQHGNLTSWARQGVLLLNTVLTVEESNAHSHAKKGWEVFTDKIIQTVNDELSDVVFLLWGAHAQKKVAMINEKKHYILASPHPSPLSAHRGFFGCQHFSKTNNHLISREKTAIDWQV